MSGRFQSDQGFISLSNGTSAMILIAAAALFGWVLTTGWRYAAADWLSTEPRYQLRQWQEKGEPISEQQWPILQSKMSRAIAYTPANPVLHDFLAALYAYKGQQSWEDVSVRRSLYTDAKKHLELSLNLRPQNARTWISLAAARYAIGEPDFQIFDAVANALQFAPYDLALQRLALSIVFARWSSAPQPLKVWARGLYSDSEQRRLLQIDRMIRQFGVRL